MNTGAITKNSTLATTFQKPTRKSNTYVRLGYVSLTIFNHTLGQYSGSMKSGPINMIHKSRSSTKEGLTRELKGYCRSSKVINWIKWILTPKRHPRHYLPQTCREENMYVRFEYVPQTIFNHTRVQVSISMNTDSIQANKQVNNQRLKYDN